MPAQAFSSLSVANALNCKQDDKASKQRQLKDGQRKFIVTVHLQSPQSTDYPQRKCGRLNLAAGTKQRRRSVVIFENIGKGSCGATGRSRSFSHIAGRDACTTAISWITERARSYTSVKERMETKS